MNVYLMPLIGNGSHFDPFRPKYQQQLPTEYQQLDYAQQMLTLVICEMTLLQETALLTASAVAGDVLPYPADLDAELTLVEDVLPLFEQAHESRNIPCDWMAEEMTYRTIARRVFVGIFGIANKMKVGGHSLFGVPWSSTFANYSVAARTAFHEACGTLGFDSSGVLNNDTVREALEKVVSDADSQTFVLGSWSI